MLDYADGSLADPQDDEGIEPDGSVPGDWYELCSYVDGVPQEFELTAMQHTLVCCLLGLGDGQPPRPDEEIADILLPALLDALRNSQAGKPEGE